MKAAVIGAGLAGAAAARVLAASGAQCVLFDKGRGPGGRLSSRRADTPAGELRFDHGAQYVTARTASFAEFLRDAEACGAARIWGADLVSIDRRGDAQPLQPADRYIGDPSMSALIKHALAGLDARFARRARKIKGRPGAWIVHFEDGEPEGPFDRIAVTLPPEQLIECLARSDGDFADIIAEAKAAVIAPCWTVMALPGAPFDPGFDGAKIYGGAMRWMARMGARPAGLPDREGGAASDGIVIQASPDWSAAFLEADPEFVARQLCEEAFVRFAMPEPVWSHAHRWRYAMVTQPAGTPCALAQNATVGAGGDWRLGGKAESAWTSGEALGQALLAR